MGVEFEPNAVVGKLYDVDELMGEMGYDAVFVGTGAGLPSYLGIEGEALNGVCVANELLTRVNLMKAFKFPEYATPVYAGKKCVVVGGGNVAMDAARTAKRLGADVTIVYRRGRDEMPARAEEIHHAEEEGIHFQLLTNPVRAFGNDEGWITGLECVRMELGEPDASGRRRPVAVEGSEFTIDIDMLVISVGSRTNPLIAQTTPGLESTKWNTHRDRRGDRRHQRAGRLRRRRCLHGRCHGHPGHGRRQARRCRHLGLPAQVALRPYESARRAALRKQGRSLSQGFLLLVPQWYDTLRQL